MKKRRKLHINSKVLKGISSIVLSVVLGVTGLNVGALANAVSVNQELITEASDAPETTAEQKEVKAKTALVKQEQVLEAEENTKKAAKVVKELKSLRTTNSSTFLLSDGSKRLELYGADIRYEKNGGVIDYDPSLKQLGINNKSELKKIAQESEIINTKDVEEYAYVNASGDSKQYFPKNMNEKTGIVLEKDDYAITFTPITETENNTQSEFITISDNSVDGNNITYTKENNEVEYKYISLPKGVKEEIILNEEPQTNVFSFDFNIPGMELKQEENSKSVQIIDSKTKTAVAYISAPNIKDVNGDVTYDDVCYEIEEATNGQCVLKVVVDEKYLKDSEGKYPIVIDPTILWMDSYLESASLTDMPYITSINMKNAEMMQVQNKCNTYGPYVNTEKYCYIDTSSLTSGRSFVGSIDKLEYSYIEKANLRLVEYESNEFVNGNVKQTFTPGNVEVRPIEGEWTPDTVTWSNHPDMSDEVLATFQCTAKPLTEHTVDITKWARSVISKKRPNYGLALRAKETNTGDTFYSGRMNYVNGTDVYMKIEITYRDTGRYYGIPGVYLPTGNYSETTTDMSVQSVMGSIALTRTYNSLQADSPSMVGKGFSFCYAMRVIQKKDYVLIIMPDGAVWSFEQHYGGYRGVDNRGKLTLENGTFKLKMLDSTEYCFNESGYLKCVKDINQNQINIVTYSNGNIDFIEDDNGMKVVFSYTNNLLTKLEQKKGNTVLESVEYSYENNCLTKVKYLGGQEKHYEYDLNGKLSTVWMSGTNNANPLKQAAITYYTNGAHNGMVAAITDSINVTSEYTYSFQEYSTIINDSNSADASIRKIKETYDESLAVIKVEDLKNTSANQKVEEVEYVEQEITDPDKPTSSTDKYGNVTRYEYNDDNENLTKTTYPDGSTEESVYDQNTNNLLKFTDRNGLVTENTYNTDGNLISTKCGGIQTATYTYYAEATYGIAGLVKTETDDHGNTTTYEYDNKGNVTRITQKIDGTNHITKNTYDDKGQLIKEENATGICTEYDYNPAGAVYREIVSDSQGENMQVTCTRHDVLGRVIQVVFVTI